MMYVRFLYTILRHKHTPATKLIYFRADRLLPNKCIKVKWWRMLRIKINKVSQVMSIVLTYVTRQDNCHSAKTEMPFRNTTNLIPIPIGEKHFFNIQSKVNLTYFSIDFVFLRVWFCIPKINKWLLKAFESRGVQKTRCQTISNFTVFIILCKPHSHCKVWIHLRLN